MVYADWMHKWFLLKNDPILTNIEEQGCCCTYDYCIVGDFIDEPHHSDNKVMDIQHLCK